MVKLKVLSENKHRINLVSAIKNIHKDNNDQGPPPMEEKGRTFSLRAQETLGILEIRVVQAEKDCMSLRIVMSNMILCELLYRKMFQRCKIV